MEQSFKNEFEYYKYFYRNREKMEEGLYYLNYSSAVKLLEKAGLVKNRESIYYLCDAIEFTKKVKDDDSFKIRTELLYVIDILYNYIGDELIIVGAYEQYLKTLLLENNIIIHKIINPHNMQKKQKLEPINYMKNVIDDNYIISENTLGISCIMQKKYLDIIDIDKKDKEIVQQMIKTRNLVHLSKVVIDMFNKEKVEFIYKFYDILKQKEEETRKRYRG